MVDPIEMDTDLSETQQQNNDIAYAKVVCPGSMRSSYWKFFGFPANESGQILTRSKIICSICRRAISYNKNTTNLRSHLNARHPNYVQKYLRSARLKQPQFVYVGKQNLTEAEAEEEYVEEILLAPQMQLHQTDVKNETIVGDDAADQLINILTEEVVEVEDSKFNTTANRTAKSDFVDIEYLTTLSEEGGCYKPEEENVHSNENSHQNNFTISMPSPSKKIVASPTFNGDLVRTLGDMICADLLPLNIVDGTGFQAFLKNFIPNAQVPSSELVCLFFAFAKFLFYIHNLYFFRLNNR